MTTIPALRSTRKPHDKTPSMTELRQRITEQSRSLVSFAIDSGSEVMNFRMFERELRDRVFDLARTIIVVFLIRAEEHVRAETPTLLLVKTSSARSPKEKTTGSGRRQP
jgi:hypothetical protein